MKIRILLGALLLPVFLANAGTLPFRPANWELFQQNYPNRTVVIKQMAAPTADAFFSANTNYTFEIYKAGDLNAVIAAIKADKHVESCVQGKITGDYTAIVLNLKEKKNKAWFIALFKKAGLNHVKFNQNEVTETDKL